MCTNDYFDCVVTPWSEWGKCSASCHEGTNTRTRSVLVEARCAGTKCPVLTQTKACMDKPCDCTHVTCSYERHDCTNHYELTGITPTTPTIGDNKMAYSAFRTHRLQEDSEYSYNPSTNTSWESTTLTPTALRHRRGLSISRVRVPHGSNGQPVSEGTHDPAGIQIFGAMGTTAGGADTHDLRKSCFNESSIRVYHSRYERYFKPAHAEGHHCKLVGTSAAVAAEDAAADLAAVPLGEAIVALTADIAAAKDADSNADVSALEAELAGAKAEYRENTGKAFGTTRPSAKCVCRCHWKFRHKYVHADA